MKWSAYLFCYFVVAFMPLSGQILSDSIPGKLILVDNKDVKALYTDANTSVEKVKTSTYWKDYDATFSAQDNHLLWLKFDVENRSKDTLVAYFFSTDRYTVFYRQNTEKFHTLYNGFYETRAEQANPSEDHFAKLTLLPFHTTQCFVKLSPGTARSRPNLPALYSERGYWEFSGEVYKTQANSIGFIYFYVISLVTIFVFALVFWLRLYRKLYLYYLGYLFFQIIYGLIVLRYTAVPIGKLFQNFPKLSIDLIEPIQFMFIGFYVYFVIELLQIKKYDKRLTKALFFVGGFCFLYAIARFIFSHFIIDGSFTINLFLIIRLVILPLNLIFIFWILLKVRHPLLIYFIIGQTFFFAGAILSTYVAHTEINYIPGHFFNFTEAPNIIFQIGLLAEVYCFSLALGKNVFILQEEKERASTELIDQLQENQRLQETMNRELDKKVQVKTDELIKVYSDIEKERAEKTRNDFAQKIKETEMVALRSQMNPHFIFNSMSAIKNLIMTSRNEDAINYLDDFSGLLREILQNSNRQKITVEEELEILELYLSLEQNRMGDDFSYTVEVTSKEELSQYQIPPLLLQPIVENAIWHGLLPSQKAEKKLIITFDTAESLKIIIEDNGIGRKESAKKSKMHNSMGATIVQDRLTLYNHLNDHSIHMKTIDLESNGKAVGTRIILTYHY